MNKKDPLAQFRGKLEPAEIAAGMNAAARNVKRLLADAELLLAHGRFPLAASVSVLAIEEAGKISILRAMSAASDDATVKKCWRDYRSHQAKNIAWIFNELVTKGARTLNDFLPIFDTDSDHPVVLDALKQIGLYTDCCGCRHWSEPHEVIDEPLARHLVFIAKILCPKSEITTREVELWVQYVAPEWGKTSMRMATYRFYEALVKEGLNRVDLERVGAFLNLEPNN